MTGISSGIGVPGLTVPAALAMRPLGSLRVRAGQVIDAAIVTRWAVDPEGRKRLPEAAEPGWPILDCEWDAPLVRDGSAWRAAGAGDALEDARRAAKARVIGWMTAFETSITGEITEGERTSWRDQEPAAHAILAGEADHPGYELIDAMRGITGETRPEVAERIVARADAYRQLIGPLVGYRRTIFAAIDAASDPAEVEAETADGLVQLTQFASAAAGGAP